MGILTKTLPVRKERQKSTASGEPRKSVDLTLVKSIQKDDERELFTISQKTFDALQLANHSIGFTDEPLTVVVVTEDSPLVIAMQKKRESAKEKSRQFGAPDFIKLLESLNLIPAERAVGFKATFDLIRVEEDSEIFKSVVAQAEEAIEGSAMNIMAVATIKLDEITSFVPTKKPRKPKEVAEPVDPAQTAIFTPGESDSPGTVIRSDEQVILADLPEANEAEYTGEPANDDVEVD